MQVMRLMLDSFSLKLFRFKAANMHAFKAQSFFNKQYSFTTALLNILEHFVETYGKISHRL